jgi:hypothetical protein
MHFQKIRALLITMDCHILKGEDIYRPSHRNGSSSIVASIRCRENVYGHSSIVVETVYKSQ